MTAIVNSSLSEDDPASADPRFHGHSRGTAVASCRRMPRIPSSLAPVVRAAISLGGGGVLLSLLCAGCGGTVLESNGKGQTDAGTGRTDVASAAMDAGAPRSESGPDVAADSGTPPPEGGCTEAERTAIWAKMDVQPLLPTKAAALLALKPFPSRAEAESVLCVGHDLGDVLGDGSRVEGWGSSNEVQLTYDPATGDGKVLSLYLGYTGSCDFTSEPAKGPVHAYHLVVGQQIQKDGLPFELNWSDPAFAAGNEVYSALLYTFGRPSIYTGEDMNCLPAMCPLSPSTTPASFLVAPLSFEMWFADPSLQPAASTIVRVDLLP